MVRKKIKTENTSVLKYFKPIPSTSAVNEGEEDDEEEEDEEEFESEKSESSNQDSDEEIDLK